MAILYPKVLPAVWNPKDGNISKQDPNRHVQPSRPPSGKAKLIASFGSSVAAGSRVVNSEVSCRTDRCILNRSVLYRSSK